MSANDSSVDRKVAYTTTFDSMNISCLYCRQHHNDTCPNGSRHSQFILSYDRRADYTVSCVLLPGWTGLLHYRQHGADGLIGHLCTLAETSAAWVRLAEY